MLLQVQQLRISAEVFLGVNLQQQPKNNCSHCSAQQLTSGISSNSRCCMLQLDLGPGVGLLLLLVQALLVTVLL